MGQFTRGEIILFTFPFSDLSQTKKRPALVLAEVEYGDLLLCQITSKTYEDRNAVQIDSNDFQTGSLPLTSYARPGRLLTADPALVVKSLGQLTKNKRKDVVAAIQSVIA